MKKDRPEKARRPRIPEHVAQSVGNVASLQARARGTLTQHQRSVEWLTMALGRPRTLYVVVALVAVWIGVNTRLYLVNGRALDPPPFPWLQGAITLGALLMATMVLITQNRQTKHAEQRAALDLQVNLLAEQKIAKLIALIEELRRDLPVRDRIDREAEAMKRAVDPQAVMSKLEATLEEPRAAAAPDDDAAKPDPPGPVPKH